LMPRIIFNAIYMLGSEIVEFIFKIQNTLGAIHKVSSEIAGHKMNILSGFHQFIDDGKLFYGASSLM